MGESAEGIMAVAAPIYDYKGRVVAGLSVGWPRQFVPDDEVHTLIERVRQTARQISHHLGASDGILERQPVTINIKRGG
jgi:DNA-binding IclR family transcriptional regulator